MTCYREDCKEVNKPVVLYIDFAIDADDGYGDYDEIYLCKKCANGKC